MSIQEIPSPPFVCQVGSSAEATQPEAAWKDTIKPRRFEYVAIDDIKPNPHYVREPNRAQRRKLKASYRKFGENAPPLVDKNLRIVAGAQRLAALKDLGRTHVWVLVLDHLTDAQARAYALSDNRIAEDTSWDQKKLAIELKELESIAIDFELRDIGFETAEIDFAIQSLEEGDFDRYDEFEQPAGPAVSAIGDLWFVGPHRLLCDDSTIDGSYSRLMQGDVASAIFTDPPYNVKIDGHATGNGTRKHREFIQASGEMSPAQFTEFLASVFLSLKQHSVDGALIYSFMDHRHVREILGAADCLT
jgi:hypothetical protein